MDIYEVQTALAAAMADVEDSTGRKLHCYEYVPNAVLAPAFYVAEYDIDPHMTMGGRYDVRFTCRLLVSGAQDRQPQKELAGFLSQSGASSIFAAVQAARGAPGQLALDGAADDLSIVDRIRVQMFKIGETSYYGAQFAIRVVGS